MNYVTNHDLVTVHLYETSEIWREEWVLGRSVEIAQIQRCRAKHTQRFDEARKTVGPFSLVIRVQLWS